MRFEVGELVELLAVDDGLPLGAGKNISIAGDIVRERL
jgi:hypothetical protein